MVDLNEDYYIDDNDNFIHVLPFDQCIESIKHRLDDLIKKQNAENERKIEEDEKKNGIDEYKNRLKNSFEVTENQWNRIHAWQKEHNKKHGEFPTAGERYMYYFMPTSIGTFGTCKCMLCNEEFDFQEAW